VASDDQIKMIELKVSQGAKPGHGGVLPAAKVSEEISRIRGVADGRGLHLASLSPRVLNPDRDDAVH
jgi:glutamate synthase domain-containing protein 2